MGQSQTTMGGGIPWENPGVEGDSAPSQSLHVGHWGALVEGGAVEDLFLQNGVNPGRRGASRASRADGGAPDANVPRVDVQLLLGEMDDDEHRVVFGQFGRPDEIAGFLQGRSRGELAPFGGECRLGKGPRQP